MVIFSTIVGSSLGLFRVFSVQNGSNEILIFSSWCLQFCQKRIVWSSGQFQTPRRGLQWDIASKFQIINVNFILINNKEIPEVQPCLLSSENILQLPNEYLVWQCKWQARCTHYHYPSLIHSCNVAEYEPLKSWSLRTVAGLAVTALDHVRKKWLSIKLVFYRLTTSCKVASRSFCGVRDQFKKIQQALKLMMGCYKQSLKVLKQNMLCSSFF